MLGGAYDISHMRPTLQCTTFHSGLWKVGGQPTFWRPQVFIVRIGAVPESLVAEASAKFSLYQKLTGGHGIVGTVSKTTIPFRRGELSLLRRIGRWNVVFEEAADFRHLFHTHFFQCVVGVENREIHEADAGRIERVVA